MAAKTTGTGLHEPEEPVPAVDLTAALKAGSPSPLCPSSATEAAATAKRRDLSDRAVEARSRPLVTRVNRR